VSSRFRPELESSAVCGAPCGHSVGMSWTCTDVRYWDAEEVHGVISRGPRRGAAGPYVMVLWSVHRKHGGGFTSIWFWLLRAVYAWLMQGVILKQERL
jgi:hypothetical protein